MRTPLSFTILLLGFCLSLVIMASPANADQQRLRVCNYTSVDSEVSIGRDTAANWISAGWYGVPAGLCRGGPYDAITYWDDNDPQGYSWGLTDTVYFRAVRHDGRSYGGEPTDNVHEFCAPLGKVEAGKAWPGPNFEGRILNGCAKSDVKVFTQIHLGGTTVAVSLFDDGSKEIKTTPYDDHSKDYKKPGGINCYWTKSHWNGQPMYVCGGGF